ncbi:hypothetical protein ACROYT_G002816 [Oculina patagonica]
MADGKAVKKFLSKHPHFELFKDDQNREKVKCKLTGHELPARLSELENYIKGKKYQRLIKEVPDKSPGYKEYKEFLVPSENNRNQLYCQLTKKYINNAPHHIQRHITGKRFTKALEKYREEQKLAAEQEDADEDMWVPSDLESESEVEKEEDGAKKMDDENDSGGDYSSEDEEVLKKKEDGLKRKLKETEKSKPTKKIKAGGGTKLVKEKHIKQPKVKQHKKTKPKKSKT